MIDQDTQLLNIASRKKPRELAPARLGSLLEEYITAEVAPKYRQFSSIEQAWRQAVPDELASHCWCDSISGGQLKIIVDSPSYMYKLQVMSAELTERLDQLCRKPRIRKIRFVPGFNAAQPSRL